MLKSKHRWQLFGIISLYVFLITLPYLFAWGAGGETHVFNGLLINPIDGNSYLAKMRQGFNGAWSFNLPYSYEPGEGAYIMMLYLLLGHIARLLHIPLALTFHLARLISAVFMALSLERLCRRVFPERGRWLALTLALFGSGLGWLAVIFGQFTSDLWVVEAYPFLAGYATPHFALGMALQLWLLGAVVAEERDWGMWLKLALAGLGLSLLSPFAVVVIATVGGGLLVWRITKREAWRGLFVRLLVIGVSSTPAMVYDLWVSQTHPVLKVWHAQNLTVSPPWWDLLLALSPALLLAVYGARLALKGKNKTGQMLAMWLVVCLVLVYLPFSLQRRFLHGLYVAIALLAVRAIVHIVERWPRWRILLPGSVVVLSVLTNVVVLLSGVYGANTLDPSLYITKAESRAFAWIEENTADQALVLAAPDTGLVLPVYTQARVLYGHPFETVQAEEMEDLVVAFYGGSVSAAEVMGSYPVRYVFYGPRERQLGRPDWLSGETPVYDQDGVQIYKAAP